MRSKRVDLLWAITLSGLLAGGLVVVSGCSDDTPGNEDGDGNPDQGPGQEADQNPDMQADVNPDPNPAPPLNPDPNPAPPMNPDPNPEPMTECGNGVCEDGEDEGSCPDDCAPEPVCEPGESECLSNNAIRICSEDGLRFETQPCEVGSICVFETNACETVICQPGAVDSCASQNSINICNENGTGTIEDICDPGLFCDFINGAFVCTNQVCNPGESRCRGLEGTETCAEDGTQWVADEDCEVGTQCDDNECKSLCEINSKVSSFLGCEYWSVDLDNIEGGTDAAHAVVISNPSIELDAEITVYRGNGDEINVAEWNMVIPPGQQGIYRFNNAFVDSLTNTDLLDTGYIDGTMVGDQSFRFVSSIPTTAHQFNPLVENNVFTNDASLLLPTNAAGQRYLVMSWKHRGLSPGLRGFVTVVAIGEEPVTVTVTPTVTVEAGTDRVTNEPIPAIGGGETREFVMMPGQVLNLETSGPAGADLTGTEIITTQPVVVFGGHECANIPAENINFCDHIEQQIFPLESWGSQYIMTSFSPRGNDADIQVFRILASEDQTVLTTTPPQPGADGITLNRGEFVEFQSSDNFTVAATAPILVGQYMTGSRNPGGNSIGDPAFTLASPIQQWRRDYIVLTPAAYNRGDFLNLVAPTGVDVLIDDVTVTGWAPIADGVYSFAKVPVEDGTHTLLSDTPFTVIAYGYDSDVSYAYPGGLNLETINR